MASASATHTSNNETIIEWENFKSLFQPEFSLISLLPTRKTSIVAVLYFNEKVSIAEYYSRFEKVGNTGIFRLKYTPVTPQTPDPKMESVFTTINTKKQTKRNPHFYGDPDPRFAITRIDSYRSREEFKTKAMEAFGAIDSAIPIKAVADLIFEYLPDDSILNTLQR